MTARFLALPALLVMCLPLLSAQDNGVIYLTNPSFEDMPQPGRPPIGWMDCGFERETPPDVQPGQFGVSKAPQHGNSYLGMVVRANETWEAVTQRLSRPMEKGKCYEFSLYLCRAEFYLSPVSATNTADSANFVTPAKLRIWGGFSKCDKKYLLYETKEIISHRWLEYACKLEPEDGYTYITLEAYYKTPVLFPYNGNVLIDNLSEIKPINCKQPVDDTPVADALPITPKTPATTPKPPVTTPKPPVTTPKPPVTTPKTGEPAATNKPEPAEGAFANLRTEDLREGQTIRIDKLFFKTDSAVVLNTSYPMLEELYTFMSKNPEVSVEIGGHTNSLPPDEYCDKLSTARAKFVYDYLIKKGIPTSRMQYKGYGKRKPVDTNNTADGRRNNQRVEVKILKLG